MQAKVLSNAIWNAINGSSSAVVAVLVPPFLTRLLTPEAYGAWALALQIGTYVSLFGFGIQMAVGRYVAYHEAREDYAARDGIVATAFWFLACASVIGWLAICGVALTIEWLVPNLAPELVGQTRWAIVLVGLALAINLPSSVFAAVFTGMQKSDVPAKIQGGGRLILAAGLIVAGLSRNLALLGLVYVLISVGTVLTLAYAWRTRTTSPTISWQTVAPRHGRELASFCISLTIWNFAMLLTSGVDLLIVGRYEYAATPFYAVSVTLVTLIAGTITSLASAMVPASAALTEGASGASRWVLLERGSRLIIGVTIIAAAPLIFAGDAVLGLWLGRNYASEATAIVALLTIATLVRNLMLPYVTFAIGLGYQRKMIATPLIEGVVSICLSIALAVQFGALGVAIAKVAGGAVGVGLLLAQHCLRTMLDNTSRTTYVRHAWIGPLLALIPVALVYGALVQAAAPPLLRFFLISLSAAAATWLLALDRADRAFAKALVQKRWRRKLMPDGV